jgi:deazaflavin-dependent oxidoreductase (nitroreductase family)
MTSGNRTNTPRRGKQLGVLLQRMITGLHTLLYRLSRGKIGGRMFNNPVLLLTTTGRKTGKRRVTPLLYVPDGPNMVLIASNGGARAHPAWYFNLQARPVTEVQVGSRKLRVRAQDAGPKERQRLWPVAVSAYSGYAGYQERTQREIPIVILRPVESSTRP